MIITTIIVGNCYLSQCFVSLPLARQQHNYFQFCLSKIPLLYRYFCSFAAQQQIWFSIPNTHSLLRISTIIISYLIGTLLTVNMFIWI
jgi:hypothetical protein